MTHVLKHDGIDHWVAGIRADGSNEGVDYDVVHMYCGRRTRFKRPVVVLDGKVYAPITDGVPLCLFCIVVQSIYVNAELVMNAAGGDHAVAWLQYQMGGPKP